MAKLYIRIFEPRLSEPGVVVAPGLGTDSVIDSPELNQFVRENGLTSEILTQEDTVCKDKSDMAVASNREIVLRPLLSSEQVEALGSLMLSSLGQLSENTVIEDCRNQPPARSDSVVTPEQLGRIFSRKIK